MNLTPETTVTPGKSHSKRKKLFDQFFAEFWADIGDTVYFKNAPKKRRTEWTVIGIETDHSKCKWTKGGYPNFIHLKRADKPSYTIWTCSNQLTNAGFKQ